MTDRPRLLVLSHLHPFARSSGQQQRVYYSLRAARERFHVVYLTPAVRGTEAEVRSRLAPIADEVIMLPSRYHRSAAARAGHRLAAALYAARTGLKASNYVLGRLEFTPDRLAPILDSARFDCALFQYWHAARCAPMFQARGIPCVLEMHDIQWQSYRRLLDSRRNLPAWWRRRALSRYKAEEEAAWRKFDAVIAINKGEQAYVESVLPDRVHVFFAAMGIDLADWPRSGEPAEPPRVCYYGGLGSSHNAEQALRCYHRIMPEVWARHPGAELWLVGNSPRPSVQALASDPRVRVTGFVEQVQSTLRTMSAVLCPWSGTFGFRSRLVEVMALGVPVVATPDAVFGMEFEEEQGLLLGADDAALARQVLRLLDDRSFALGQSRLARQQVERLYSLGNTYERFVQELRDWVGRRTGLARTPAGATPDPLLSR